MKRIAVICVAVAFAAAPWTAPARAQGRTGLQLALDKPVAIDITDAPIAAVFQRLTDTSGVKFLIGDEVYECLPYGDQTRLAVKLKNITLRKALSPMLAPQAMEWTIEKDAVRLLPAAALLRMNRRATYDELRVLGRMHSATMQPTKDAGPVIARLRKAADNKDLKLLFHVEADQDEAVQRAERVLPGTAASWLDMLCHGKGWTWYLWGDDVMIIDAKMQVSRQLQRQVSLRYDGAQLVTVLLDLARQSRVKLNMDPGVMDLVPVETRSNFNLMMADASVAQALEVISGATGLVFVREAHGLRVEASDRLKDKASAGPANARRRSPFLFRKSLPLADGSTVDLIIRPEDLPEDVMEAIQAERQRLVELLIRKWRPTTRPATTQPAATQPAK